MNGNVTGSAFGVVGDLCIILVGCGLNWKWTRGNDGQDELSPVTSPGQASPREKSKT